MLLGVLLNNDQELVGFSFNMRRGFGAAVSCNMFSTSAGKVIEEVAD